MASRRIEKASSGSGGRRHGRESELRRLGPRESALVREVRRHLRAHPLEYDERGFSIDQSSVNMPKRLRPRPLASD